MTRRALSVVWLMLLAALAGAQPPAAENPPRFDFEQDVDRDNFPDGWQLVGTRHPENVRERLDASEHRSGAKSFLVAPDGQGCTYETALAYPFDPRLSWRLTGWIKTSGLPSTGLRATTARVEAALLEADGRPPVRVVATPGLTGTNGWVEVSAHIPRDVTSAARSVRLRIVVDGTALAGKAWFDDVALEPEPRIDISAGKPAGFLLEGAPARATIRLDTLLGDGFKLSTKLIAPDGAVLANASSDVKPGLDFTAESTADLPFRALGLHRIEVELTRAGKPVATVSRRLLYARPPAAPRRELGVAAESLPPGRADAIALTGAGLVSADVFSDDPAHVAERFARLRELGIEPVAVLGRVPESVVRKLFAKKLIAGASEATWPRILSLEGADASEELLAALKPIAPRVAYYQLGAVPEPDLAPADIRRAVAKLREILAPQTWDRKIVLPAAGREPDDALAAGADALMLRQVAEIERFAGKPKGKVEFWLEVPASSDGKGLVERLAGAKASGADRAIVTPLEGALLDDNGEATEAFSALVLPERK